MSSTKAGNATRAAAAWFQAQTAAGFLGAFIFAVAALALAPASAEPLSPDEARAIAKEATIYGFPLVDSYRVQYSYFVDRGDPEYKAPWNILTSNARVATPDDKAIPTPNPDTPYSFLGADLRAEPLVLTVPAVEKDRYYSLQFTDMRTFNFAYVGSRATGNGAAKYLLAGPDWHGETPPGVKAVIRSETEFAFVLYRTQLFTPADIDNVKRIQAGYKVEPLSHFLNRPSTPLAPPLRFITPLSSEEERTSPEFFDVLDFVLSFCPPNPAETKMMARFARLGIAPHARFDPQALSPEILQAVQDGMADAWAALKEYRETQIGAGRLSSADGFGSGEFPNDDDLARMSAAALGAYGASKAEAISSDYFVDDAKRPLSGDSGYELRFARGQLPPVNAFWSLTLYDLPSRRLWANRLNRYLINSPMLPSLRLDDDGGVTLYIRHSSPGPDKETNWLPAPSGPFFLAMRLYWPKPEARDGQWTAPPLVADAPPPVETKAPARPEAKPPSPAAAAAPPPASVEAKAEPPAETKPPIPAAARAEPPAEAAAGAIDKAEADAPVPSSAAVPVTPDNFPRAESDLYFGRIVKDGGFGRFTHRREPVALDKQTIIRMNRDTLYSGAVFDLDAGPVTVTLPDAGKRFMSMQVIDEDEYTPEVDYGAGSHKFTKEGIGTRYVLIGVRMLVDANDPKDVEAVHALQDAIKVDQPGGPGKFETPNWDQTSQTAVRETLLKLAPTFSDTKGMFGPRDAVDPAKRLVGAAMAWGGNPEKDALYLNVTPARNDGKTIYKLRVKDAPVDGFWSISVYDAKGYFEPNPLNAYSINNTTAKPDEDGSISIQFGGCDGRTENCLPTPPNWNYLVRLYRPRPEILNGSWTFPEPQQVD